jgi:hypothetical protein
LRLPTSTTTKSPGVAPELGVAARHRDVVEEDVAVGVAARAGGHAVQQEPGPRVRPALDHQQRRSRGERVDAGDRLVLGRGLGVGEEVGPEDRGGLRGALGRYAGPVVRGHLGVSSCGVGVRIG